MSSFNDGSEPLLLQKLGFTQVGPMHGGVYHFRNDADQTARAEYIGLFYSPVPVTAATKSVQLFIQLVPSPLPSDVSPLQIQNHWQNLDARRLEESGLQPMHIDLCGDEARDQLKIIQYARPAKSSGIRYCVQLPTLEVVCYN